MLSQETFSKMLQSEIINRNIEYNQKISALMKQIKVLEYDHTNLSAELDDLNAVIAQLKTDKDYLHILIKRNKTDNDYLKTKIQRNEKNELFMIILIIILILLLLFPHKAHAYYQLAVGINSIINIVTQCVVSTILGMKYRIL